MSRGQVRSYRAADFTPGELLRAKGDQRVSVVVPARDEQETVGDIVSRIRRDWMAGVPLVDQLVVVDSDSTDATAARAAAAGATVVSAAAIRPDLGPAQGKGEALWKAQHVVTGDLLVFVDADLTEWGSHFVPGLLGPLLTLPEVALVKSCYQRPLRSPAGGTGVYGESGGRVTELVARPLIALHRPELADVVQPLSGEWAVRRSVLRELPIPVGYGVEIAVLLDTASRYGVPAIAQVDLGRRGHRHHHHDLLGAMALQVMAAVERRIPNRLFTTPDGDEARLRQFARVDGGFVATDRDVAVWERPPAVLVGLAAPEPIPAGCAAAGSAGEVR